MIPKPSKPTPGTSAFDDIDFSRFGQPKTQPALLSRMTGAGSISFASSITSPEEVASTQGDLMDVDDDHSSSPDEPSNRLSLLQRLSDIPQQPRSSSPAPDVSRQAPAVHPPPSSEPDAGQSPINTAPAVQPSTSTPLLFSPVVVSAPPNQRPSPPVPSTAEAAPPISPPAPPCVPSSALENFFLQPPFNAEGITSLPKTPTMMDLVFKESEAAESAWNEVYVEQEKAKEVKETLLAQRKAKILERKKKEEEEMMLRRANAAKQGQPPLSGTAAAIGPTACTIIPAPISPAPSSPQPSNAAAIPGLPKHPNSTMVGAAPITLGPRPAVPAVPVQTEKPAKEPSPPNGAHLPLPRRPPPLVLVCSPLTPNEETTALSSSGSEHASSAGNDQAEADALKSQQAQAEDFLASVLLPDPLPTLQAQPVYIPPTTNAPPTPPLVAPQNPVPLLGAGPNAAENAEMAPVPYSKFGLSPRGRRTVKANPNVRPESSSNPQHGQASRLAPGSQLPPFHPLASPGASSEMSKDPASPPPHEADTTPHSQLPPQSPRSPNPSQSLQATLPPNPPTGPRSENLGLKTTSTTGWGGPYVGTRSLGYQTTPSISQTQPPATLISMAANHLAEGGGPSPHLGAKPGPVGDHQPLPREQEKERSPLDRPDQTVQEAPRKRKNSHPTQPTQTKKRREGETRVRTSVQSNSPSEDDFMQYVPSPDWCFYEATESNPANSAAPDAGISKSSASYTWSDELPQDRRMPPAIQDRPTQRPSRVTPPLPPPRNMSLYDTLSRHPPRDKSPYLSRPKSPPRKRPENAWESDSPESDSPPQRRSPSPGHRRSNYSGRYRPLESDQGLSHRRTRSRSRSPRRRSPPPSREDRPTADQYHSRIIRDDYYRPRSDQNDKLELDYRGGRYELLYSGQDDRTTQREDTPHRRVTPASPRRYSPPPSRYRSPHGPPPYSRSHHSRSVSPVSERVTRWERSPSPKRRHFPPSPIRNSSLRSPRSPRSPPRRWKEDAASPRTQSVFLPRPETSNRVHDPQPASNPQGKSRPPLSSRVARPDGMNATSTARAALPQGPRSDRVPAPSKSYGKQSSPPSQPPESSHPGSSILDRVSKQPPETTVPGNSVPRTREAYPSETRARHPASFQHHNRGKPHSRGGHSSLLQRMER